MLLSVLNAPVSSFARVVNAVAEAKPADGVAPVAEEVKEAAEQLPKKEIEEEKLIHGKVNTGRYPSIS